MRAERGGGREEGVPATGCLDALIMDEEGQLDSRSCRKNTLVSGVRAWTREVESIRKRE